MEFVIEAVNRFIKGVGDGLRDFLHMLPGSPFQAWKDFTLDSDIVGFINWFIPISQIILVLEAWVFAIAGWYVMSVVLRWLKAIE
ncbi:hypothetical protein FACS18949_13460 [Clostridia bacterium]|nr:hypothetical protein FACS189425_10620 [Clostridia bacterium]GHV35449.1 hypothetical protein FACS18949_13460 [Clostridia bacterium]